LHRNAVKSVNIAPVFHRFFDAFAANCYIIFQALAAVFGESQQIGYPKCGGASSLRLPEAPNSEALLFLSCTPDRWRSYLAIAWPSTI
jgi:hypothetical protein